MELVPTEFHFLEFLNVITSIIRVRAEQKGIDFTHQFSPNLPSGVYADETRLRQVLLNLLGNAAKFTLEGRITFTVTGTQRGSKHKIRFQVDDTGIGIPANKTEEIFLPFQQVADKRIQDAGTGLGLAISQKLVQMMKGQLQIKSREGGGSTFWFELTLPGVTAVPLTQNQTKNISGYTHQQKPLRILVADDMPENRRLVKILLARLGFKVAEAATGQEAIAAAAEFQPHLIFMDLVMPGLDGYKATQRLRQTPELADVVVIAISATASSQAKKESLAAGCNDYLTKPLKMSQLLAVVRQHLHLEWIYSTKSEPQAVAAEATEAAIIPPPAAVLAHLHELALDGDISELKMQLAQLTNQNPKYAPFATQINGLAGAFLLDSIQETIEKYLEQTS
jgi:CheY-like chemotaxis protein